MTTIKHVGEYGMVAAVGAVLMVAATGFAKLAADAVILLGETLMR